MLSDLNHMCSFCAT